MTLWDSRASQAVAQHLLEVHQARAARGVDAEGRSLPPRVDLVETGELRASWAARHEERAAEVTNTANHAGFVDARIPIVGMTDVDLDGLDAIVAAELDRTEANR